MKLVSFLCFLPSSHYLKQSKCMYFIVPAHLHTDNNGLSGSSVELSVKHIQQGLSLLSASDYLSSKSSLLEPQSSSTDMKPLLWSLIDSMEWLVIHFSYVDFHQLWVMTVHDLTLLLSWLSIQLTIPSSVLISFTRNLTQPNFITSPSLSNILPFHFLTMSGNMCFVIVLVTNQTYSLGRFRLS